MLRILQVTPKMDYGGVASVVRNFYAALDHDEIVFDFVDHGQIEDYHHDMKKQGSNFYYFDTLGKVGIKRYKQQIVNNIDLSKYDIVHIHLGDLTGIYARIYRSCGAKCIINHAHGSKPVSKKRKYFEWLLRYLAVREADACIACGVDAGNFIFGKGKYQLVHNGIDIRKFECHGDIKTMKMKEKYDLEGKKVIVHIGNYLKVKNQLFLLDVLSGLKDKYPHIVLFLAGEGPDRTEIEKKIETLDIKDNVIVGGTINDIPTLLHISDIFVLPSLSEGLPMSGIEAQSIGIPCIFSNNIDHDIDIGNQYTYFLPIDKGVEMWIDTLSDILENHYWDSSEEIHERLKRKGYDINENAKLLRCIYKELVK